MLDGPEPRLLFAANLHQVGSARAVVDGAKATDVSGYAVPERSDRLEAMRAQAESTRRQMLRDLHATAADRLADLMEAEAVSRHLARPSAFHRQLALLNQRTSAFEAALDAFFAQLDAITDPAEFARLARTMPAAPDLDAPEPPPAEPIRIVEPEPVAVAAGAVDPPAADTPIVAVHRPPPRPRPTLRFARPRWRASTPASDPWWDLDGSVARRERTETARRQAMERLVMLLASTLLVLILARLPDVDASALVHGSGQPVLMVSLLADAVACTLVLLHQVRVSRTSFRGPVALA